MTEQEYVVQKFRAAFSGDSEGPIIIYGLGKNTEAILRECREISVIGLMDAQNVGKVFWGLPVLREEEVIEKGTRIAIVARDSVVPIIYERIAHLQEKYGIKITDFKGEHLSRKKECYGGRELPYWSRTEEQCKHEIDCHEVISFDIFDTLLMRLTLEPTDIFDFVEKKIENMGMSGTDFARKREVSEKMLRYPTIWEIYQKMGEEYGIDGKTLALWKQVELETEKECLVPRRKMIELFYYALEQHKKVYLVSDMYYSKGEIVEFLKMQGIEGYTDMFISCDYRQEKSDGGLYKIILRETEGKNVLHIGDNRFSDGEKAREAGIDTFLIYSAYDMWMSCSMQFTLSHISSFRQRFLLGLLVHRFCENPFALQANRGMLKIYEPEDFGYLIGPLFTEFLLWLKAEMKATEMEKIILLARDGYLIYYLLGQEPELGFTYEYLKASRRAVSVPTLKNEEDICRLAEKPFQGCLGELLYKRFGIEPAKDDCGAKESVKDGMADVMAYIASYEKSILERAEKEREEYLAYLGQFKFPERTAVFDFIAGGTVQYYLEKLLGRKLQGLYFATVNKHTENSPMGIDISAAYGNIASYGTDKKFAKNTFLLETIMTDKNPMLLYIDNKEFVYDHEELRDSEKIEGIGRVQQGILRYHRDSLLLQKNRIGDTPELDFADDLFGIIMDNGCELDVAVRSLFVFEEYFAGVKEHKLMPETENERG